MSFLVKNAEFVNKKVAPKNVDFEANNKEKITVLSSDKKLRKNFKNILQGNHIVKTGIFKVDTYDKVNRQWTRKKVAVIKNNKFIRKWPGKFWLFTSLLLNKNFYNEAKINYIDKKFSYLSYSTSKNNKTDLNMREKLAEMIAKFVDNSLEIEEQWLNDFLKQIIEFNNTNLEKEYEFLEKHIKIIIKDYYLLIEKNKNLELMQTFLQTLWDKVYSFMELSSLCICEYNAKNSKDKDQKKLAKELNFRQINFIARRQMKVIDLKVTNVKWKIEKNNFIIKNLKKQIIFELGKSTENYKKIRELEKFFVWRKAAEDQRFEFRKKQEKMFFEGLSDEATNLRGKIVEVMHDYHKKVLNNECEKGEFEEFKIKKEELKNEINSIYKQSSFYIKETTDLLGFEFNLISLKPNKMEEIWFQILTAIYLKKYNLIFYNLLSSLNDVEKNKLINAIDNLEKINEKFCAVFIEDSIYEIPSLKSKNFLMNELKVSAKKFDEILEKNWSTYAGDFFAKSNRYNFTYDGKKLEILNDSFKIQNLKLPAEGKLLISPMKIYTNKKENKNYLFDINTTIVQSKDFLDKNMKMALINDTDLQISFYSEENYSEKEKVKLYISEEAILKVL